VLKFSAVDLQLTLRGSNLEHLFPLLGMALPATPAYATEGRLVRDAGVWRYEKFSGRVGASDIAGSLQVVTLGPTPVLTGDLVYNLLNMDDLGPVIGLRPDRVAHAVAKPVAGGRVLPDLPFNASRWRSVDADVQWRAKRIVRANALPLENLVTHLRLKNAVLTLTPLDFGIAGGHLTASIVLDGRQSPIQAQARVRAQKISFAQLFPRAVLDKRSLGQINGEFNLSGQGNSVGQMLASANGKLGLVVTGGEISKLMMEKAGLHLWEIFTLNLTGDRSIKLRCAVADFDVKAGLMQTDALVFDTEITTILGTGTIDLKREQLNLTLKQKTKNTSPLALRSPIYVRGSFANPTVQVDKGRMAVRAAGAVALGLVNPLLALIPLIDAGPGQDSDCGALVREARSAPASGVKK
jgi:AsmA protein